MKTLVFGFITAMVIAFVVGAYWNTDHHKNHAYEDLVKRYQKEIDKRDKRIRELEKENESYNKFFMFSTLFFPNYQYGDYKLTFDSLNIYRDYLRVIDSLNAQEK